MLDLKNVLEKNKGETMLIIVPHIGDECFLAGGALQIAKKYKLKNVLMYGTQTGNLLGISEAEEKSHIQKTNEILCIDEVIQGEFVKSKLYLKKEYLKKWIQMKIEEYRPKIIITYDESGVTGHLDHIMMSLVTQEAISLLKKKPILFVRTPNVDERKHFNENTALTYARIPTYALHFSFKEAVRKIHAMNIHMSGHPNRYYKLHLLDHYLFNHTEYFCRLDINSKISTRLILKEQ